MFECAQGVYKQFVIYSTTCMHVNTTMESLRGGGTKYFTLTEHFNPPAIIVVNSLITNI